MGADEEERTTTAVQEEDAAFRAAAAAIPFDGEAEMKALRNIFDGESSAAARTACLALGHQEKMGVARAVDELEGRAGRLFARAVALRDAVRTPSSARRTTLGDDRSGLCDVYQLLLLPIATRRARSTSAAEHTFSPGCALHSRNRTPIVEKVPPPSEKAWLSTMSTASISSARMNSASACAFAPR